jgi:uncharacterized protein YneF (UPF0154 family)
MKNKIWIYVLVGILALGIGFFLGKMVKKKKEEKESEDKDGIKSGSQRKIIDKDGKSKIVDSSYQLQDGETEIPRVNI